ncbi:hypothetical protein [Synechococcus sp. A15-44]|uniref:hypothetical protein n=1 Tax=Synechococcus sp. A15-44 TaxID=1050646 RepID=UPI0016440191|nr:hypothetical protein [Synechococcus sp. A15-44]
MGLATNNVSISAAMAGVVAATSVNLCVAVHRTTELVHRTTATDIQAVPTLAGDLNNKNHSALEKMTQTKSLSISNKFKTSLMTIE